jgi:hypothetical protein
MKMLIVKKCVLQPPTPIHSGTRSIATPCRHHDPHEKFFASGLGVNPQLCKLRLIHILSSKVPTCSGACALLGDLPCCKISEAEVADAAPSVKPRTDLDDFSRYCLHRWRSRTQQVCFLPLLKQGKHKRLLSSLVQSC